MAKKNGAKSREDAKSATGSGKGAGPQGAVLPLFFKQPAPLDKKKHEKVGLNTKATFVFARDTNSVPVNVTEFVEIAKFYPIVFTQDEQCLPIAVLGLQDGNYFVDAKGQWERLVYVPAYVRKYPFALVEIPNSKQMALCIDEKSEHFVADAGKGGANVMLLHQQGEPTDITRRALEFCGMFQQQFQLTQEFCRQIAAEDIFASNNLEVTVPGGGKINLGGLRMVDEQKLRALPEAKVADWHKKGWLALLYYALMSYTNWMYLAQRAGDAGAKSRGKSAGAEYLS